MKSANNLFDLVVFTEKHATTLCGYIADLPAGDDKNEYVKRKQAAFNWSVLDQKKVKSSLKNEESTLDRVQEFIDELKPR
jgi:phage terminase Nu1 subunit (DNA packaging protein)